jgi:hypothetical protein
MEGLLGPEEWVEVSETALAVFVGNFVGDHEEDIVVQVIEAERLGRHHDDIEVEVAEVEVVEVEVLEVEVAKLEVVEVEVVEIEVVEVEVVGVEVVEVEVGDRSRGDRGGQKATPALRLALNRSSLVARGRHGRTYSEPGSFSGHNNLCGTEKFSSGRDSSKTPPQWPLHGGTSG